MSTVSSESLLELCCFVQSTSLGEEALYGDEKWTLWNPILNTGVFIVDKRSVDEGNARYKSTTHFSETICKKTALVCGLRTEERCLMSGLGALQGCLTWIPPTTTNSECRHPRVNFFWLKSNLCHSVDKMTLKQSPLTDAQDSSWSQQLKKKRLYLRLQFPSFMFSAVPRRCVYWQRRFRWSVSSFRSSLYSLDVATCNMRGLNGKGASDCAIMSI